jgi:hypothetical protein
MLAITANTQAHEEGKPEQHRHAQRRLLGLFDRVDEAERDRHEQQEAEAAAQHRQLGRHANEGAQHRRDHGQCQQPVGVAQDLVPGGLAGGQVEGALGAGDHVASVSIRLMSASQA